MVRTSPPPARFPTAGLSGVSGCKQMLAQMWRGRRPRAALRCCRDLGGVSGGCWGQSCPPACPRPRDEPRRPFPGGREIPSPETCLPHPIFFPRSHPAGLVAGRRQCGEGLVALPRAEGGHCSLRWEGTVPIPLPVPLSHLLHPVALPGSSLPPPPDPPLSLWVRCPRGPRTGWHVHGGTRVALCAGGCRAAA